MLRNISGIIVQGAIFNSPVELNLFGFNNDATKNCKCTLLYGRNGTGKSTIAKAFRKLAGESMPSAINVTAHDNASQQIALNENDKKHIFVFDEDYVFNNVKIKDDHLDAIVMLGEAADLSQKIDEARKEKDTAVDAFQRQEAVYNEYFNANNVKSPLHYIRLMQEALRGDSNWAGRDRRINGTRQNASVHEDTYKQFADLNPSEDKTKLLLKFELKMKELEAAKAGSSVIPTAVPSIDDFYFDYDDEIVQQLLEEKIERPELSERENRLFSLLQDENIDSLRKKLEVFSDEKTVECPFCFQPVSSSYKETITQAIERILNETLEKHLNALEKTIIAKLEIDLSPYQALKSYHECEELKTRINTAIEGNNQNLKAKIDDPFNPITIPNGTVKLWIKQLDDVLNKLENERVEYNKIAKKTEPIIAELRRINSDIAYYDIKDSLDHFNKQTTEFNSAKKLYLEHKSEYEAKIKILEDLEAQMKNIKIAVDAINACFKYIFFAEDRLRIEYADGVYKLLSHGRSVKPNDVSLGERNIIGLCYFFTEILKNKEEKEAYGEEYLLIIDDPISSYDFENRIGILSFFKYKLGQFLTGNEHTRALVMTHDLMTFYDVQKITGEIIEECKNRWRCNSMIYSLIEIRNAKLTTFSFNNRQEYTEILKIIYEYASGNTDDYDLIIGNIIRQALEAFSTFLYRKGIEAVSRDTDILALLPAQEYILYYKNLMYRLLLHGGSHKSEQIKAMHDLQFFNYISEEEKVRTAQDILCLIYLLNKQHVLAHLDGCDKIEKIEKKLDVWCQSIKTRAA